MCTWDFISKAQVINAAKIICSQFLVNGSETFARTLRFISLNTLRKCFSKEWPVSKRGSVFIALCHSVELAGSVWLFFTLAGFSSNPTEGLFIWARSTGLIRFPRSRLATLFSVKISMCSYEGPGWPGYRDIGFCDQDLGNGDENFPILTLQPGDRDETFSTK